MGTLITYIMDTVANATKEWAHGLGTTPDYIVVESLTDTNTTAIHINVVTYGATSFSLRGSIAAPGTPFKATVVKIHSIVG